MRILIVGCGKVGEILTAMISKEGHDVVAIDINGPLIDDIVNKYDVMGVVGNGANRTVLDEAGVAKADLLISVADSDELNILCCMMARRLGARHTIARVRNPEYTDQIIAMRKDFGISMVVCPEFDAAHEILRTVQFPEAIRIDTFAKGRVDMAEVRIGADNPIVGKSLIELSSSYKGNYLICAVRRGDEVTIPSGSFVIEAGDVIHITASHSELIGFFRNMGVVGKKIHSVMLIGGGRISYYLAKRLLSLGINVKIIELDRAKADYLADQLPKAMVICADGTDSDVLIEEGIDQVDACVSLTGIDEENIIMSMFAGTRKVDKVITKINRLNVMKMLSSIGLESIVSPKDITANNILRYVRAIESSRGGNIQTLYKIVDGKAEAIEFIAGEDFAGLGTPIKDLKLKKNLILACINRGRSIIFPHGNDTIMAGDSVIVVARGEEILNELDDILN